MKLQRIAALLAAMGLVVALEAVLMRVATKDESAMTPVATAVPAGPGALGAPGAGQDPNASTAPLPTAPVVEPGVTSPPGYNGNLHTQAPSATERPAEQQEPTKKPDPTQPPAPTAEPTEPPSGSVGSTLSSGNFSSNTGTRLNISVSWKATELGNGKARVTITGSVNSYSLSVAALPVSISFGNYSASVTGNSVSVPNESLTSNTLFSTSIDVDSGTEGDMTVTWKYNGTYGDVSLSDISASGYVYT